MQQQYLRSGEAASYLRKSASWLSHARCRGEGPPYFKAGGTILYKVVDIDAWVASLVRQGASEPAHEQAAA